jgi:hypothetical protein
MRGSILLAASAMALAACAEVTPLRNGDGTVDYYIDCNLNLRLESCQSAMRRACPSGYDLRPAGPQSVPDPDRPDLPQPKPRNDGLFRCR